MHTQRTSFATASHRHTAGAVLPIVLLLLLTVIQPHALMAQITNGSPAASVLGQPNLTSDAFASTQAGLSGPRGVCRDPATGKLFVADYLNNRVLRYASASALLSGANAEVVFGQPNFTSNSSNNGGRSASTLVNPVGIAIDNAGNLFVVDNGNHRVLRYPNAANADQTATAANLVFGQPDMASGTSSFFSGRSASTLNGPQGIAVDNAGNLFVVDQSNNRVLRFANASTATAGNTAATVVFGQADFTSNNGAVSQNALWAPAGVAIDNVGNLYVADVVNHRIVRYANAAGASNQPNADLQFGQPNFTSRNVNQNTQPSASTLANPYDVSIDNAGNLYVAENGNNRVLRYVNASTATAGATAATLVLGQADFVSNSANRGGTVGAGTMSNPRGIFVDSSTGNLFVTDYLGNRVLRFGLLDTPATSATASATSVSFGTNFIGGATTTQNVTLTVNNVNANDSFTYTFGGATTGVTANETGFTTTANTNPFNRTITLSLTTGTATTVNGFLYIRSSGSSTTLATINLSGIVVPVTTMTVSPSSIKLWHRHAV
jgi:sugar lactone lactonase YvrE